MVSSFWTRASLQSLDCIAVPRTVFIPELTEPSPLDMTLCTLPYYRTLSLNYTNAPHRFDSAQARHHICEVPFLCGYGLTDMKCSINTAVFNHRKTKKAFSSYAFRFSSLAFLKKQRNAEKHMSKTLCFLKYG